MSLSRRPEGAGAAARRKSPVVPVVIFLAALLLLLISMALSDRDGDAQPGAEAPREEPAAGTPGAPPSGGQDTGDGDGAPVEVITPEAQPTVDMARRDVDDPLAVGPVDAPVTLIVYSDYQCPFCASWATDTGPVLEEYAAAGDLRIEYRDIALFGEESQLAAQAAYAAGLQGGYLEYQKALFPGGDKLPPRGLREPALVEMARDLGLDAERFAADLSSPEVGAAVQRNIDEAAAIGAFSTPAFLLAEAPILGAQPTEVFVQAMDAALSGVQ